MILKGTNTVSGGEFAKFSVTGSVTVESAVRCESMDVTGVCTIGGGLSVSGNVKIEGVCTTKGDFHAEDLQLTGTLAVEGNASAGKFKVGRGVCAIEGTLKADEIYVKFEICSKAAALNAKEIIIRRRSEIANHLPDFLTKQALGMMGKFSEKGFVTESVAGDKIDIEYVKAETVKGKTIIIGEGCEVGTVYYSESVKISPKSKVERQIKTSEKENSHED